MTVARPAPAGPAVALTVAGVILVSFNMRAFIAGVPPVLGELGLGSLAESLLVSVPVLCFAGGALAGPWVRARFGEERGVFLVTGLLLAGMLLRAAWPSWGLFPGTIAAALGGAVLNVLLPTLVKLRFPGHIGLLMGAYTMTLTAGAALVSGLTVPVFEASGKSVGAALGVWAIPVAAALVVWSAQLRVRSAEPEAASPGAPLRVWRNRLAWSVTTFLGLQSCLYYGALSWVPEIYTDRGLSDAEAGVLLMIMGVAGIPGSLAAPMIGERMRDQRAVVAGMTAITAVGLIGLWLGPNWSAVIWIVLLGFTQGGALSLAMLMVVIRAPDGDIAARLSSMAQAGGFLIAATGPLAMGLLHAATGGWTLPILALLAIAVVGMLPGLTAGRNVVISVR
jgi:CP family cyanate transporter-like MFS transporter